MPVIDYWCVPNTRYAYQQLMMYVYYDMDLTYIRMYDSGFVAIDGWLLSDWYSSIHGITDAYLYDTFVIDLWSMITHDIAP